MLSVISSLNDSKCLFELAGQEGDNFFILIALFKVGGLKLNSYSAMYPAGINVFN